jgi:uncharacterized protein YyaL (SSP411 family)
MKKHTNSLIHASSPYLLQHAHNPVNWEEWSDEIIEQAKKENKLMLVSIGYAACHWCHVMEHACFEDDEVAELMNEHFICIKVDREERPDIDQIYMTAVQLMTQRGGWPLNCFTLPNGNPIYGGTYFPKAQWIHILKSLVYTQKNNSKETIDYSEKLLAGIQQSELITQQECVKKLDSEFIHELVLRWSRNFDTIEGGESRAPKFPMPSNYDFLLQYAWVYDELKISKHLQLTLDKMAMGGIYDQIGGGFSRYAVDMLWKVPHFEKMLYDNAQLLSLYSQAYKIYQKPLYKRTAYGIVEWLEREMISESGAFYSAIDADSEGEEGKFYCWNKETVLKLFPGAESFISEFYSLNQNGYWEEEKYILLRRHSDQYFIEQLHSNEQDFEKELQKINSILLDERKKRIRPSTDDKCLTSWNALTISGLCDAYMAFNDETFLFYALKCARWMMENQIDSNGFILRNSKNGKSSINGFLDDYSHTIQSFIKLNQATNDQNWIVEANKTLNYVFDNFFDKKSQMFYFTPNSSNLIARKMELIDNVIPSSNSVMAHNLFNLGRLCENQDWINLSQQMLYNIMDGMEYHGSSYSNWANLFIKFTSPHFLIKIKGNIPKESISSLQSEFLPHCLVQTTTYTEDLPEIQICDMHSCLPPFNNLNDAVLFLTKNKMNL